MALVDPRFLDEVGWDPDTMLLSPGPHHPLMGRGICRVADCAASAVSLGMCPTCAAVWRRGGSIDIEEFVLRPRTAPIRRVGECVVPGCPRPRGRRIATGLCSTHDTNYLLYRHLSVEQFCGLPHVVPLPDFGFCQVPCCDRRCDSKVSFCPAHRARWRRELERDPRADRREWMRTARPVAMGSVVGLGGLPPLVLAEVLLGLQTRCRNGSRTEPSSLRGVTQAVRDQHVGSLFGLQSLTVRAYADLLSTLRNYVTEALSSPEQERLQDLWNLRVFGHGGGLRFTGIRQHWLRETAKRWAADELPRHRGHGVAGYLQNRVNSIVELSDSLHAQRRDHGHDPSLLGPADMENFLNRVAYLESTGAVSAKRRPLICEHVAKVLRDARELGLTRPGEPAAGLPDMFALRSVDIPPVVKLDGPGRALPQAVLRQLYENLSALEASTSTRHGRPAIELLMDTGRRPEEILQLRYDCLDTAADGKYVLVYAEFKINREGRRLPITDTTANLIRSQQQAVRALYPDTPVGELALLPGKQRNPRGTRSLTLSSLSTVHRGWVDGLPPLLVADGTEFDKAAVVLYAYRHSYAQRHADAGTPPDVLRELMGHKALGTTQTYYRVTEHRIRGAVDKIVQFQFDRHGARIWKDAKALLDHEHARMRVGAVAVPFGTCTEPSNVSAGGQACPFRFRCLGCGHFRTDPSYLPELRDYLQTLLRNRERIMAATDLDDWAAAEATPSEDEITRLRALIRSTEEAVDDLSVDEQGALQEATAALRMVRRVQHLGMPGTTPPRLDPRLERDL